MNPARVDADLTEGNMTATGLGICDYCVGLNNWLVTWRACRDVFSPVQYDLHLSSGFRRYSCECAISATDDSSTFGSRFALVWHNIFAALGIDPFGVHSFSLVCGDRRLIVVVALLLESVGHQNCREPPCTGLVLALFPKFADMEVSARDPPSIRSTIPFALADVSEPSVISLMSVYEQRWVPLKLHIMNIEC
jgi:hypothetical protein